MDIKDFKRLRSSAIFKRRLITDMRNSRIKLKANIPISTTMEKMQRIQ